MQRTLNTRLIERLYNNLVRCARRGIPLYKNRKKRIRSSNYIEVAFPYVLVTVVFIILLLLFRYSLTPDGTKLYEWKVVKGGEILSEDVVKLPFYKLLKKPTTVVLETELPLDSVTNYLYLPQVDASYLAVFVNEKLVGSVGFSGSRDGHFYYQPFIFELPVNERIIRIELSGVTDIGIDFVPTIISEKMKDRFILLQLLTGPIVYVFIGVAFAVSVVILFISKNLVSEKKKAYILSSGSGLLSLLWVVDSVPLLSLGKLIYFLQRLSIFSMYFSFAIILYVFARIHFGKIDKLGKILIHITAVLPLVLLLVRDHSILRTLAYRISIIVLVNSIYLFVKGLGTSSKTIKFFFTFFLLSVLHDFFAIFVFYPQKLVGIYGAFALFIGYGYNLVFEYREIINKLSVLHKKSITDTLTGAFTRGALNEMDFQENDAFVYVDLNNFKEINDRYGHKSGDQILKAFVSIVKSSIRKSDSVFRMGGDEFLIVLKECPLDRAKEIVEGIRTKFNHSSEYRPDFSYGISNFSSDLQSTLSNVDILMYKMKDAIKSKKELTKGCKK